jgi:hypothetical protein
MADRAARVLEAWSRRTAYGADDGLVFAHPETGKPLDRSKVTKRFKAACRDAGVRPIRFHDLRHTFGTRLAAAGEPMRTILGTRRPFLSCGEPAGAGVVAGSALGLVSEPCAASTAAAYGLGRPGRCPSDPSIWPRPPRCARRLPRCDG